MLHSALNGLVMADNFENPDEIAKELAGLLQEYRLLSKDIKATRDQELIQASQDVKASLDEVGSMIKEQIGIAARESDDRAKARTDLRTKIAAIRAKLNQATTG